MTNSSCFLPLLLDAFLSSILAHIYTTATQIIGIEYTHNKNNYGLKATPRYRPLPPPPSELGGEERKRKVQSPNRIRRWLWLRNPIHMHTRVQTM
ncbi:hypothetical protein TNCV_3285031 [Trichonephila clavipes]|nr:hypothetical protein TNCV_3285031 [Trichonephila clavipes]